MIALPKATSQGSNGAGGGALRAFSGRSAAYAEPAIANTAAAKTNFFIKSPQKVISESASDRQDASRIALIRRTTWYRPLIGRSKKCHHVSNFYAFPRSEERRVG